MLTTLLSFLGGATFRMVWGEVAAFISRRQDHQYELQRLELQAKLDDAAHKRQMEAIVTSAQMQVKVVEAQAAASVSETEALAWLEGVKATRDRVGVLWIDAWNAVIRPGTATWALAMLTLGEFAVVTLSEGVLSVCSAALGIYLAERNLIKRGK